MALEQLSVLPARRSRAGADKRGVGADFFSETNCLTMLEDQNARTSAASYPPLQRAQGRGTHFVGFTHRKSKAGPPAAKHQASLDRIAVYITKFLDSLALGPNHEVVKTALPELRFAGFTLP